MRLLQTQRVIHKKDEGEEFTHAKLRVTKYRTVVTPDSPVEQYPSESTNHICLKIFTSYLEIKIKSLLTIHLSSMHRGMQSRFGSKTLKVLLQRRPQGVSGRAPASCSDYRMRELSHLVTYRAL